jgi:hypothetical protein
MEANEAQELQENAEHAQEGAMRSVAFTMAVLAVLVAIATVLGHRTHTEAVLDQNRATDQWNYYQAHNLRLTESDAASDNLSVSPVTDKDKAAQIQKNRADNHAKWTKDMKEEQEKARDLEKEVALSERRADHYDLGEALLEIGLVVTSVTLLTRRGVYWYFGMVFGAAGVVSSLLALLVR